MKFLRFLTQAVNFKPTLPQRVWARVAIDDVDPERLVPGERDVARVLFGDVDRVPASARGVVVLVKGARVGGSYLSAAYLLWRALFADLSSLAPGEVASALSVGPDIRLARQLLRYARGAIASIPALGSSVVAETGDGFTLRRPDGREVRVEALPATRGGSALRGRSLVAVVFTEAAFFRDVDSGIVNDEELFRAVSPRIMPGGKVIIESTPWLESGLLYAFYRDDFGDPKSAIVALAPTLLMRPDERTRVLVEAERLRDPDNAAQEFDAKFLGGGAGAFFDANAITAAIVDRPLVIAAPKGAIVGNGCDIGLVSDSSASAVVAKVGDVFELLEIEEMRPAPGSPLKLSEVIANFAAIAKRHGCRSFVADGHAREPSREYTDAAGIRIDDAPEGREGKVASYVALRQIFNEGRIRIPNHVRLVAQLRAIVARPVSGGGYVISSPRKAGGGHGDLVSALVLAVWAATEAQPVRWPAPRQSTGGEPPYNATARPRFWGGSARRGF